MSSESTSILQLPELWQPTQLIRIPDEIDVPVTDRVRSVIDCPAMQRLRQISQLGLVSLVYPGAVHSRLEHSLGVYRLGCMALRHFHSVQPEVISACTPQQLKIFLLACLLHDVGHWPYCHPIEDLQLPTIASHEHAAQQWVTSGPLARVIDQQWQVPPGEVAAFLVRPAEEKSLRILQGILNGPVDIDKIDYLQRDSLHAGVPYGKNFDQHRLMSSFRLMPEEKLAITAKGKTAAEMLVFSRYVMFSEVYWHHSVRAATAMLQRAIFHLQSEFSTVDWQSMSDAQFQQRLIELTQNDADTKCLAVGLFGSQRKLFKRLTQYSYHENPVIHSRLAHLPYDQLVRVSDRLVHLINQRQGLRIAEKQLLIDAPPVKLEIQFRLQVLSTAAGLQACKPLADLSPVVKALATDQFDKHVKQVRVYVAPELRSQIEITGDELDHIVQLAIDA